MIEIDNYHKMLRDANKEAVEYFNWIAETYPELWVKLSNEGIQA